MMNIRQLEVKDGKQFLQLMLQLDHETSYMMYEPNERKSTVSEMENMIETINKAGIVLGIEENDELVGFASIQQGQLNRIRHSGYVVIGIIKKAWGKGYGKALLEAVDK